MTTTLRTLKTVGGVETTDQTVTPLAVTGLDWEQQLNRTVNTPGRSAFVQIQLGTPTRPRAVLQIMVATWGEVEKLRLMYASALPMVLSEPDLAGLSWRHRAADSLRWSPIIRPHLPSWWVLTVTAEEMSA